MRECFFVSVNNMENREIKNVAFMFAVASFLCCFFYVCWGTDVLTPLDEIFMLVTMSSPFIVPFVAVLKPHWFEKVVGDKDAHIS